MRFKASATTKLKHSFSKQHLVGAKLFYQLASGLEVKVNVSDDEKSSHRAYVTGAIIFSAAFLEASINELFLEAVDGNQNTLPSLSDAQRAILAELWDDIEQNSTLNKYQIALAACGVQRFDRGTEPFQGIDSLIRIRNALIHYRPEWDDELDEHKKIRERVGNRFAINPLVPAGSLWFPHLCLSAGCAKWGIQQTEDFMKDFCKRLKIPNRTT